MSDLTDFVAATEAALRDLAPELEGRRISGGGNFGVWAFTWVQAGDYDPDEQAPEEAAEDLLTELVRQNGRAVWDVLDTPIYRVLDPETGENMGEAQIRSLGGLWLYVDDENGFRLLDTEHAERLAREPVEVG